MSSRQSAGRVCIVIPGVVRCQFDSGSGPFLNFFFPFAFFFSPASSLLDIGNWSSKKSLKPLELRSGRNYIYTQAKDERFKTRKRRIRWIRTKHLCIRVLNDRFRRFRNEHSYETSQDRIRVTEGQLLIELKVAVLINSMDQTSHFIKGDTCMIMGYLRMDLYKSIARLYLMFRLVRESESFNRLST